MKANDVDVKQANINENLKWTIEAPVSQGPHTLKFIIENADDVITYAWDDRASLAEIRFKYLGILGGDVGGANRCTKCWPGYIS